VIWLSIALGGAMGAAARHAVNIALHVRYGSTFPWATFTANAVGCLAIGLLAGAVAAERIQIGELGRAFLFVGLLGGFTTFSSFGLDTLTLVKGGAVLSALLNVAANVLVSLAAVWVGYALGSGRI
jgi:CrcB protein